MRLEDWFALAVRVIGVLIFLYGIGHLLDSFLFRLGYFNYPESSPGYYVIAKLSYVFVGLYLIRGAPQLVRFAYPIKEDEEKADQQDV
jgi:hypothetical protein